MNKSGAMLMLLFALLGVSKAAIIERVECDTSVEGDIYGFSARPLNGSVFDAIQFSDFQGQVVLISNVASYNSRTTQRYMTLNTLQESFGSDLVVLGYPNNQFNHEEPGATATELINAIRYVRPGNGFEPNFILFTKTDVNGGSEDEIFTYLKSACSFTEEEFNNDLNYDTLNVYDVRQPFEMFLVGKTGKPTYRYHASLSDDQILLDDITALAAA